LAQLEHWEEWERLLFAKCEFLVPFERLLEILCSEETLKVTDGAAEGGIKGSFGWVLCTRHGERLLKVSGPAFGAHTNSYRSEGYGMLSSERFTMRASEMAPGSLKPSKLYCDNISMVGNGAQIPEAWRRTPNSTLASDYDVIAEIWDTQSRIPEESRSVVLHVKGHQDDRANYQELTLPAKLNVDADELAGKFLEDNPDLDYSRVVLLPTSGVQLNLQVGTITYDLKHKLKEARTTEPLKDKLCHKQGWSEDTFQDIDWEAHRRAINRNQKWKITLVKYLHKCLPVGKLVRHYDKVKYRAECPSCTCILEDDDHVFTCPGREAERKELTKKLKKKLEALNTESGVQELVMAGVKAAIYSQEPRVSADLRELAEQQSAIGWTNLLRGRMSKQWIERQRQHIGSSATKKKNALTWATTVIDFLFKEWHKIWEQRNLDRHGKDYQEQSNRLKDQGMREMNHLYGMAAALPQDRQWMFNTPIEECLSWPLHQIRAWISNWKNIIEEAYATQLETG
jgi:hypothetical protein